jgi:hypothetical protein
MTESAMEVIVTSCMSIPFSSYCRVLCSGKIIGVDSHIPEHSLGIDDANWVTGERLSIPCPSIFRIAPHLERRPSDIIR